MLRVVQVELNLEQHQQQPQIVVLVGRVVVTVLQLERQVDQA
jgi:hypothetical protein